MSTVRYFNGVPYVVRYGMQDDKEEIGWILFWRCGVKFTIHTARVDVLGTPYEKEWTELNQEPSRHGYKDWVGRWERLCDCVISQAMSLLVELAPAKQYWTTLRDYLHTPGYILKMVTDLEIGDAKAVITSGPTFSGAYELQPMPEYEVGSLPEDLPRYTSDSLIVTDKETDWRSPPHRVRIPDGTEYALQPVERNSRWGDTGKIFNTSLETIRAYVAVHDQCEGRPDGYPARIPHIVGIVLDQQDPSETPEVDESMETLQTSDLDPLVPFIAGVLMTLIPNNRTLYGVVRDAKEDVNLIAVINSLKQSWKQQTLQSVHELHERGLYCGARRDHAWYYINQHNIRVDDKFQIWMDPLIKSVSSQTEIADGWVKVEVTGTDPDSDFEEGKKMDLQAVEEVFEVWLVDEMKKIQAAARNYGGII